MIPDVLLLLVVAIPTLLLRDGLYRITAAVFLLSLVMVNGYEAITGGYAVEGMYIIADCLCAAILGLAVTAWKGVPPRDIVVVLIGYFACCAIHGLRLMGVIPVGLFYWWLLRIINVCQLLVMGGSGGVAAYRNIRRRLDLRPLILRRDQIMWPSVRGETE